MADQKVALVTADGSGMVADSARALAAELGDVGSTGTNKSDDDL